MEKAKAVDFYKKLAEVSGHKQADVREVMKALPEAMTSFMKEGLSVSIPGVGIFRVSDVDETSEAWNPSTKEYYTRPAYKNVTFKKSSSFNKELNPHMVKDNETNPDE